MAKRGLKTISKWIIAGISCDLADFIDSKCIFAGEWLLTNIGFYIK
jgi:hypothetical protein